MAEPAAATTYAQPQAYDASGNPIGAEALPDALAAGKAFYARGSRVFARNDRGDLVSVDASEVNHPNLRVLTPDEVAAVQEHKDYGKGVGNMAKAFGAGAARTLTFGGSDVAARALGGSETAESLEKLRRQNPISSAGGEIAGAVAPLLLSGGASAPAEGAEGAAALEGAAGAAEGGGSALRTAAQAATVVPRTIAKAGSLVEHGVLRGLKTLGYEGEHLAARVAARGTALAAGGAAEGGLYGVQGAISEQALKDHDQTAENFVAGLGHGMLLGAALGGTIGAASELGSAGLSKVLGAEGEPLENLARKQGLRSIGSQAQIQKLGGRAVGEEAEQKINAAADDLLKYRIKTGELKGRQLLEKGDNAAEIAEKISYAKNEVGAARRGVMETVDDAMQHNPEVAKVAAPSVEDFTARVKGSDWYQELKNSKPLRSQFRAVDRELNILGEDAAQRAATHAEAAGMGVGNDVTAPPETFMQLNQWGRDLREKFQPPTPTGGGIPPQPPKSAKYLEKLEREMASYVDDKATAALGALGEDPNKYTELTRQYSSLSKLGAMAQKTVNRGNRMLSPSDQGLGAAGFLASVISGHPIAGLLGGGASALANNLLRTRGNSIIAGLARDATEMEGTLERTAHHLADKTVEGTGILAGLESGGEAERPARSKPAESPRVASSVGDLTEQYHATIAKVRALSEPQTASEHIAPLVQHVTDQYPEVGATAGRKLLELYQHLRQGIPTATQSPTQSLTPRAVKERVAPMMMADYLSRVRGATDPRSVIADLGKGQIDRTALDTVRELYPKTFEQLRKRATELVASREEPLPYQRTIFLSMAFGFVGDESLEPQKLEAIQQTFATMQAKGETEQSDQPGPSKPIDAQKISSAMQLEHTQRVGS